MKHLLLVGSMVMAHCSYVVAGDNRNIDQEQKSAELTVDSDAHVELTVEQKLEKLRAQAGRVPGLVDAYAKDAASMDDIRSLLGQMESTTQTIEPQPVTLTDVVTSAMLPWFIIACYTVHQLTS